MSSDRPSSKREGRTVPTLEVDRPKDVHKDVHMDEADTAPPERPAKLDDDLVSATGFQPTPGIQMGRYRVGRRIGSGGMGVVFEAEDSLLKRRVAIKFLRTTMARSQQTLERFMREAQAASQIDHPNAVATYDVGEHEGLRYVVLELLEPRSARSFIASEGPMFWTEATRVVADACRALGAAHATGLVHRDIKPDNILRSRKGVVKLTDFGLAKHIEADLSLTHSGVLLGTPQYMSPEQCQSDRLDARSDIYSMGATYYSLLCGKRPFAETDRTTDLLVAHCFGPVPDPGDVVPTLPESVRAIVRRAMSKKPEDRFPSAEEMVAALEAASREAPADDPPPRFLRSGGGSSLVASSLVLSGSSVSPRSGTPGSRGTSSSGAVTPASRRRVLALGGVAVVVAAMGAWMAGRRAGSSSAGEVGSSVAPGVVAPSGLGAGEAPPIRVGVLHSLSGTMEISEKSVADATLLAIEEVNERGGVLGRKLEPIVSDGRSDWPTFAREAARLIDEEHVAVVFGGWTSASRKTMKPVFEERDHLLFYPVQYEGLEQSPNIVYTGAAPNQQILPAITWCVGYLGAKKFFLVGSDYVFPRTANAIIRDVLDARKADVVGEEYALLGSTDMTRIVQKIQAAKPDVILNTINGDSNVAFFRTLRAAGVTAKQIPTVSFSVTESELRQISGVSLEGEYLAWNYFESVDRPENKIFVERFQKRYGAYRVVTDPMEAGYFGVHLWALGAAKAKSESPRKVREALHGMTYAAPGATVRIDPDNQHTSKVFRLGRVNERGRIQIVFSTESPIEPEPFPSSRTRPQWAAFLDGLYEHWGRSWANPAVK
jgi:urea transport system substrate-binding protein